MVITDEMIKELYDIGDKIQYTFNYEPEHISSNDYKLENSGGWTTTTTTITTDNTGNVINYPYNSPYSNGTITLPANGGWSTTISYPAILQPGEEAWPTVKDALGIVFVDDNLIKLKTKNGKEVVIGKLTDNDIETIPLEVIAAKKKLLEGSSEEGNI